MKPFYIFWALLLFGSSLLGVSAFPGALSFTQKDGTQFTGTLKGDEWLNWISLPNDYVALFNKKSKNYEYAVIKTENGESRLSTSGLKVDEQLHKAQPNKLAKTCLLYTSPSPRDPH